MDIESVRSGLSARSGRSDRSQRSLRSSNSRNNNHPMSGPTIRHQATISVNGESVHSSPSAMKTPYQQTIQGSNVSQTQIPYSYPPMEFGGQATISGPLNTAYSMNQCPPGSLNFQASNCQPNMGFLPPVGGYGVTWNPPLPYSIATTSGREMLNQPCNMSQITNPGIPSIGSWSQMQGMSAGGDVTSMNMLPPDLNHGNQAIIASTTDHSTRTEGHRRKFPNQDDNWLETGTAFTGATSDTQCTKEEIQELLHHESNSQNSGFDCARSTGIGVALCLAFISYFSPLMMVILPKLPLMKWKTSPCDPTCEGILLSFTFRFFLLGFATFSLFLRPGRASMPRMVLHRALLLFSLFGVTFAFWLFYCVRHLQTSQPDYSSILQLASSFMDCLLFLHYLAVVILELRHIKVRFAIKVVRSPDGVSKIYHLGDMPVQKAAVQILHNYMTDFESYNPYLETAIRSKRNNHYASGSRAACSVRSQPITASSVIAAKKSNGSGRLRDRRCSTSALSSSGLVAAAGNKYKFYDVDGPILSSMGESENNTPQMKQRDATLGKQVSYSNKVKGGNPNSNAAVVSKERYYDLLEYEKRVSKRKMRLLSAVEEAFAHVKRYSAFKKATAPAQLKVMDPHETAQSVFPTLLKPLQKFLRITRQQPRHSMESILSHLANCFVYDLSPRAFIEPFLTQGSVLESSSNNQSWTLLANCTLSGALREGVVFQLRQGSELVLLCTVSKLPFFTIAQEIIDPMTNRFVISMDSETSV